VKANPHPAILRTLAELGSGFEVSSIAELRAAFGAGVTAERVISSNPVKTPAFIEEAYSLGIDRFAFDSHAELDKLARLAPGSRVYARLTVDNSGSEWPLSNKYGCEPEEAVELLLSAARHGLVPYGLTFHVGSQCRDADSWAQAIEACYGVYHALASHGQHLEMLSLGGGQPVHHTRPVPSLGEIGQRALETVDRLFGQHNLELTVEPGRALVGAAASLVTSVIGRAQRPDAEWLYLDAGVFNALMETIEGFKYELATERGGPRRTFTVAGPSCDSVDTMFTSAQLPDLQVNDRVYILNAGAYTLSYASSFNGFGPPEVIVVDSLEAESDGQSAEDESAPAPALHPGAR
jgi:ornithine decarboxylase